MNCLHDVMFYRPRLPVMQRHSGARTGDRVCMSECKCKGTEFGWLEYTQLSRDSRTPGGSGRRGLGVTYRPNTNDKGMRVVVNEFSI